MNPHRYGPQISAKKAIDGNPYRQCINCGVRKRTVKFNFPNARGPAMNRTQYAKHPYNEWTAERPDCAYPKSGPPALKTAPPKATAQKRRERNLAERHQGRFESKFYIEHCGMEPKLLGNMSLRGPAAFTSVAYECVNPRCRQRFLLVDTDNINTPAQQAEVNALHDAVE